MKVLKFNFKYQCKKLQLVIEDKGGKILKQTKL